MRRRLTALGVAAAALVATGILAAEAAAQDVRIEVRPASAEVDPGQRVELTAEVVGLAGGAGKAIYWKASGGSFAELSPTRFPRNTWIAPAHPGAYDIEVTSDALARFHVVGRARFVVRAPACRHDARFDVQSFRIETGGHRRLVLTRCACAHVRWSFRCTGGTIDADGNFRAGPAPGTYTIEAIEASGAHRIAIEVVIVAPPPRIVRVAIEPARIQCRAGERIALSAFAYEHSGRQMPGGDWEWTATGGRVDRGAYVAGGVPGTYQITVRERGCGLSSTIEVVIVPSISRIEIQAARTECRPGERIAVSAFAYDPANQRLPGGDWEWTATGGRMDGGFYHAGDAPGTYRISVRERGCGLTVTVEIVIVQHVYLIHLSPRAVVLRPGQSVRFTVQALDDTNRPVPHPGGVHFRVEGGGGVIRADGLFRASGRAGRHYRVFARHPDGAEDWADVYIER